MSLALLPVSRCSDLIGAGLSRRRIRASVAAGTLIELGSGVVVGAGLLDHASEPAVHALRVRAAQLRMRRDAVASHGSAALLLGLDRLGRPSGRVRLTVGETRYRRLDFEARLHTAGLPPLHVGTAYGVATTTPARTVVDLARTVSFRSGVVVADSAMRLGCHRAELEEVLAFCRHWPGVRKARTVVGAARPEAETPLETLSRLFFLERGIPEPELQVELLDATGALRRVDFYWRGFRTIGEADGLLKYDEPLALRAEKLRQEALEQTGHVVVRWTWDDLWRAPDWTETRIRRALAEGRRRVA